MGAVTNYIPEQRIWEQLVLSHKFKSIGMSHRLRAEQRFLPIVVVDNEALRVVDHAMAHRFRYFLRNIIPFQKAPSFTEGVYFALQNEVFFNVAGKRNVNGKLFVIREHYGQGTINVTDVRTVNGQKMLTGTFQGKAFTTGNLKV